MLKFVDMKMNEKIKERWHEGTKEIIEKLELNGINFRELNAIELFGRDGSWHTIKFAEKVKSMEVWEIDSKWERVLKKNLPKATIKIKDSVSTLKIKNSLKKFDLILIDNPMNVYTVEKQYGDEVAYCEHFEIIENIDKIAKDDVLIIFNVNRKPFDYEKYPLWKKRRRQFYGDIDTSNMKVEFLIDFYKSLFYKLGFKTIFCITAVRVFHQNEDMTHYFAFKLNKI